jgi:hypothetical protein
LKRVAAEMPSQYLSHKLSTQTEQLEGLLDQQYITLSNTPNIYSELTELVNRTEKSLCALNHERRIWDQVSPGDSRDYFNTYLRHGQDARRRGVQVKRVVVIPDDQIGRSNPKSLEDKQTAYGVEVLVVSQSEINRNPIYQDMVRKLESLDRDLHATFQNSNLAVYDHTVLAYSDVFDDGPPPLPTRLTITWQSEKVKLLDPCRLIDTIKKDKKQKSTPQ